MKIEKIILADGQSLTESGWVEMIRLSPLHGLPVCCVYEKKALVNELAQEQFALVILDFSTFDFVSPDELSIISERFPMALWVLCSNEFSDRLLVKMFGLSFSHVHILYKESKRWEFQRLFESVVNGTQYVSPPILEHLNKGATDVVVPIPLSATEREILCLLARGFSSKEIASMRFISAHTVMTHRKNIFRKIQVNNVYEATKFALRAGLLEMSDYCI